MVATSSLRSVRELYMMRLRGLYSCKTSLFWVFAFPTLSAVGIGLAFHERPRETIFVDLVESPASDLVLRRLRESKALGSRPDRVDLRVMVVTPERAIRRLRNSETHLVVSPDPQGGDPGRWVRVTYRFLPSHPVARTARMTFDDALQRAFRRDDPIPARDEALADHGSRYSDFLITGLIAMTSMANSLWGVGFIVTEWRASGLMKRLLVTPMPRHSFLLAVVAVRFTFLVPEVCLLTLCGVFLFDMPTHGNLILFALVEVVGVLAFSGVGLLLACRVRRRETINGLLNMVIMPMWLFSGIFFSPSDFPSYLQPAIRALPLTHLVNAVRDVLLKGADFSTVSLAVAILVGWAIASFAIAGVFFRWD